MAGLHLSLVVACILLSACQISVQQDAYEFRKAEGGTNCHATTMITDVEVCKLAADFIGQPFNKIVTTDQDRPGGCFWDQNGSTYFNTNFQSTLTWVGTGGLCDGEDPEDDTDLDSEEDDEPACEVENCAECKSTSSEACRFCEDGYRRIARGRVCQHVTHENDCQVDNCLFCRTNDATRCRRCEGGFLRRRGGRKCKELPQCDVDGCRICHGTSTKKCKVCHSGLMKTHQGKSCVPRE